MYKKIVRMNLNEYKDRKYEHEYNIPVYEKNSTIDEFNEILNIFKSAIEKIIDESYKFFPYLDEKWLNEKLTAITELQSIVKYGSYPTYGTRSAYKLGKIVTGKIPKYRTSLVRLDLLHIAKKYHRNGIYKYMGGFKKLSSIYKKESDTHIAKLLDTLGDLCSIPITFKIANRYVEMSIKQIVSNPVLREEVFEYNKVRPLEDIESQKEIEKYLKLKYGHTFFANLGKPLPVDANLQITNPAIVIDERIQNFIDKIKFEDSGTNPIVQKIELINLYYFTLKSLLAELTKNKEISETNDADYLLEQLHELEKELPNFELPKYFFEDYYEQIFLPHVDCELIKDYKHFMEYTEFKIQPTKYNKYLNALDGKAVDLSRYAEKKQESFSKRYKDDLEVLTIEKNKIIEIIKKIYAIINKIKQNRVWTKKSKEVSPEKEKMLNSIIENLEEKIKSLKGEHYSIQNGVNNP